ncbi:MAG: hypothetical protein SX243_10255 [Acidobacteriota bacterium]|nr:hypothetical protein [Acidobacteriota bacterium]
MRQRQEIRTRRDQRGSAYLAVLMVLLLLTVLGMSLVLITQTERDLGSNHRMVSKTFYAADSAVGMAVSWLLLSNNYQPQRLVLPNRDGGPSLVTDELTSTQISAVRNVDCNLCDIATQPGDTPYKAIDHRFAVTARRTIGNRVLAQKQLNLQVEVQPRKPLADSLYEGSLDYPTP